MSKKQFMYFRNRVLVTALVMLMFPLSGSATANEVTARKSSEALALAKKYEQSANLDNGAVDTILDNRKFALKYYEEAARFRLIEGNKDPLDLAVLKANCAQQAAYLCQPSRQSDFLNDAKKLTSALKIQKGLNAAALYELARIELNAGKYDSAKTHFSQLTKYLGKKNTYLSAGAFSQLGWCYHALGSKNQAITNFRRAFSYASTPDIEIVIARLYIPGAISGAKFREFKPSAYPSSIYDVHSIAKALVSEKRYYEGEILNRYVIWLTEQPLRNRKSSELFLTCGMGPPVPKSTEQFKIVALQNLIKVYAATGQLSRLKDTSTNLLSLAQRFKPEDPKWVSIKDDAVRLSQTHLAIANKLKSRFPN